MDFRRAAAADIDDLVRLRVAMRQELHPIGPREASAFEHALREYFVRMVPSGAFISWLAFEAGTAVGSASVLVVVGPPSDRNITGLQGYVLNVYTEPDWRLRGLASELCSRILEAAAAAGISRLYLRAQPDAKSLYERLGFSAESGTIFMTRRRRSLSSGAATRSGRR